MAQVGGPAGHVGRANGEAQSSSLQQALPRYTPNQAPRVSCPAAGWDPEPDLLDTEGIFQKRATQMTSDPVSPSLGVTVSHLL